MTVEESSALIKWSSDQFITSYFVVYEQVEPHDNFGKAMIRNLKARGCPLLSIFAFPTLEDQKKRFVELGWDHVEVLDMDQVYSTVVVKDTEERERVNSLEFMDELEEWQLMHKHYCIAIASHHQGMATTAVPPPSNCRNDWKLSFSDLVVPVGPKKAHSPGNTAVPSGGVGSRRFLRGD